MLAVLIPCLPGLALCHTHLSPKQGLANLFLKAQTQVFLALWAHAVCHNHSALLCTVESATGQPGRGQWAEGGPEPGRFCCSECEWCEGPQLPFLTLGEKPLPCLVCFSSGKPATWATSTPSPQATRKGPPPTASKLGGGRGCSGAGGPCLTW